MHFKKLTKCIKYFSTEITNLLNIVLINISKVCNCGALVSHWIKSSDFFCEGALQQYMFFSLNSSTSTSSVFKGDPGPPASFHSKMV